MWRKKLFVIFFTLLVFVMMGMYFYPRDINISKGKDMRKRKIVCMLLMIGALALLFKPGLKIGDVINFSSPEIEWLSL